MNNKEAFTFTVARRVEQGFFERRNGELHVTDRGLELALKAVAENSVASLIYKTAAEDNVNQEDGSPYTNALGVIVYMFGGEWE